MSEDDPLPFDENSSLSDPSEPRVLSIADMKDALAIILEVIEGSNPGLSIPTSGMYWHLGTKYAFDPEPPPEMASSVGDLRDDADEVQALLGLLQTLVATAVMNLSTHSVFVMACFTNSAARIITDSYLNSLMLA